MDYKIVFLLFVIIKLVKAAHLPEVYEDPVSKSSEYSEDVFNFREYQKSAQHDLQKLRYKQQQVSDQHTLKERRARFLDDQESAASHEFSVTTKPRTVRKVTPTSQYTEDVATTNNPLNYKIDEASDRQDYYVPQLAQKSPKIYQQNLGGFVGATQASHDQIAVLNSLLEKAPSAQLQGLQQLLNENEDQKPIKEEVFDIPNTQSQPNIQVQTSAAPAVRVLPPPSLKSYGSLEEAQNHALQHIRAQHSANLQAKLEAETREAQIAKKNEENALKEKQRKLAQRRRIQEERARIAALAYKEVKSKNTKKVIKPAQTIHESQSENYYSHHQAPPSSYETADVSKYYNHPEFTAYEGKDEHGHHELQYAAKYAFGYRIHDVHHGNDFGHEETKDGESTKGHYHVLLPDGRVQNVQYYVDPTGYHADVTYDTIAHPHE